MIVLGNDPLDQDPLAQDPLVQDEGVTKMQFVRDFCSYILVFVQILWEVSCVRGIASGNLVWGYWKGDLVLGILTRGSKPLVLDTPWPLGGHGHTLTKHTLKHTHTFRHTDKTHTIILRVPEKAVKT